MKKSFEKNYPTALSPTFFSCLYSGLVSSRAKKKDFLMKELPFSKLTG